MHLIIPTSIIFPLSLTDSGFVVLQGTTYWTDLFVRHFLFQSEPVHSIDSDDLLFFVRKKHVKSSSRHMPKYEVSQIFDNYKTFLWKSNNIDFPSSLDWGRCFPQGFPKIAYWWSRCWLGRNCILKYDYTSIWLYAYFGHLHENITQRVAGLKATFPKSLCLSESPENGYQRRRRRDNVSTHLFYGGQFWWGKRIHKG